nr:hypothetical protein CFP56_20392 [Quercus suber]
MADIGEGEHRNVFPTGSSARRNLLSVDQRRNAHCIANEGTCRPRSTFIVASSRSRGQRCVYCITYVPRARVAAILAHAGAISRYPLRASHAFDSWIVVFCDTTETISHWFVCCYRAQCNPFLRDMRWEAFTFMLDRMVVHFLARGPPQWVHRLGEWACPIVHTEHYSTTQLPEAQHMRDLLFQMKHLRRAKRRCKRSTRSMLRSFGKVCERYVVMPRADVARHDSGIIYAIDR